MHENGLPIPDTDFLKIKYVELSTEVELIKKPIKTNRKIYWIFKITDALSIITN